ncbi:hypothetical protein [Planococcus sp. 4-30]|uniref:hypothetical protein n=1 Tax=Planococcus sp. 4-30 TaxID=2874583 RepID=UPI001CC09022|nr:hypothetical protein [Planococcus sp. 4-30]
MLLIFIVVIFQALITFIIKNFIIINDIYSLLLVAILFFTVSVYLLKNYSGKWIFLIYIGFCLRIVILLIDIYVPFIPIFGSGADTEYFHTASLKIANGEMSLSEGRTFYVTLLSGFYYFFGDQRILAQFLNIVLWIFSAIYLLKTLRIFNVNETLIFWSLVIFTFAPNLMFMTSILLRESIIIFFLMLSLYNFFTWMNKKNFLSFLFAIIFILFSMLFHAGMIGVLLSYLVILIFLQSKKGIKNKKLYLFFFIIIFLFLLLNDDLFLSKFLSLQEDGVENLDVTNSGGSAYLQSFNHLNGWLVFLLTPLKMIFFLFSPLPFNWRGMSDLISFGFDSVIYIFLAIMILTYIKKSSLEKKVKVSLVILLFISIFVFSYGTGNAGTAMRHRTKLIPLFIVAWAMLSHRTYSKRNKKTSL